MPSILDMPDLLLELDQTASAAGVSLTSIAPTAPATDPAGYSTVKVALNATGNFYSLTDLLYRLRNLVYVRERSAPGERAHLHRRQHHPDALGEGGHGCDHAHDVRLRAGGDDGGRAGGARDDLDHVHHAWLLHGAVGGRSDSLMAKTKKPKVTKQLDRAQEKARKQKRMAALLGVFLVLVLVYEVPHTMKLMNKTAKAPIVTSSATAPPAATGTSPAATPSSTTSASSPPAVTQLPAATSSSSGDSGLVAAVQVTPDPGQLTQFERFASKDPFSQSVQKTPSTATAASGGSSPASGAEDSRRLRRPRPRRRRRPRRRSISLNGELTSVSVGGPFPTAGVTFTTPGRSSCSTR